MKDMPVRRDRRSALRFQKILKRKAKLPYNDWLKLTAESIKNGTEIFNAKKEASDKSIADQLEAKELSLIEYWKNTGYSEESIEKLREVYALSTIKYDHSKKEDKKEIKKLLKEINISK